MTTRTFVGFSTIDTATSGQWRFYDEELIHRDLLNHFRTRRGERRMRPEYGCIIPDLLMEQMTEMTRNDIVREAVRVCEADSRVAVENVRVVEFENGIRVEIDLLNRMTQAATTFSVDFEQRETTRISGEVN